MLRLTLLASLITMGPAGVAAQTTPGDRLSAEEQSALAALDSTHARTYTLQAGWYASRPIQFYDLGPTELAPGSLYRVRDGELVISSIPGMTNYSAVRQVYDVELLDAQLDPRCVRSHLVIRDLAARGRARLRGTGQTLNIPVVAKGSTLER